MSFILVCLSCGYKHEVFSKLRECPRCSSRNIEILKPREAQEREIDVQMDARPDLKRKMLILGVIGIILVFVGLGLIWLTGVFSIISGILSVIGVIFMIIGVVGAWWYE
jgi:DNA-directed RNA polymerase subunit RPC12/RpoP